MSIYATGYKLKNASALHSLTSRSTDTLSGLSTKVERERRRLAIPHLPSIFPTLPLFAIPLLFFPLLLSSFNYKFSHTLGKIGMIV